MIGTGTRGRRGLREGGQGVEKAGRGGGRGAIGEGEGGERELGRLAPSRAV